MRSLQISGKVPVAVLEALSIRKDRAEFGNYPSGNAQLVGLLLYAVMFPKIHKLTVGISKLHQSEQDLIYDFVLKCARDGVSIADMEPKPMTAGALLKIAKSSTQ